MRTRENLMEDAKNVLEIISMYKVLKLEQLYGIIKNKEKQVQQSIIRLLEKEERVFIHDDIASSVEKWSKSFDKGIITAFWILLDFWEDVLFNAISAFPAKIDFITNDDAYDIIVAEKGQENILNTFYTRNVDNTIKHLVAVENEEQMYKLTFPGIAAFCIVDDAGNISYYKEQE